MKFPCSQCKLECKDFCIECQECKQWTHFQCIPGFTKDLQTRWTSPLLNFYCFTCCHTNNKFSIEKSLERIMRFVCSKTLSSKYCWGIVQQEQLLAKTYNTCILPPFQFPSTFDNKIDTVSVQILKQLSPITLQRHLPKYVSADGNCFYRAISYGLYGTDDFHLNVRVAVVLEMLDNLTFYDINNAKYCDLINDFRIICPSFKELCQSILTPGSYADMICIYAASSVIAKPIQSFMPSVGAADERCTAYTRKVVGRNAKRQHAAAFVLMWTSTVPLHKEPFNPNHFVVLEKSTEVAESSIPTCNIEAENNYADDDKYLNSINFEDCLTDYSSDSTNQSSKPIEQQNTPLILTTSRSEREKTETNDITASHSSSDDNIPQSIHDHVKDLTFYSSDTTNLSSMPIQQQSSEREEKPETNDLTVGHSSLDDNILQSVHDHVIDLTDYSSDSTNQSCKPIEQQNTPQILPTSRSEREKTETNDLTASHSSSDDNIPKSIHDHVKDLTYYNSDTTNLSSIPIQQLSSEREEKPETNDLTVGHSSLDDNILQSVHDHVIDLTDYSSGSSNLSSKTIELQNTPQILPTDTSNSECDRKTKQRNDPAGSYSTSDANILQSEHDNLTELLPSVEQMCSDCLPDISRPAKYTKLKFSKFHQSLINSEELKELMSTEKSSTKQHENKLVVPNSVADTANHNLLDTNEESEKLNSSPTLQDFLPTKQLIQLLTSCDKSLACSSIPSGIKENKYFVVENKENQKRKKQGLRQKFIDDCGAWIKVAYFKSYYMRENMEQIYFYKNEFCRRNTTGYKTVDPQPKQCEVFTVVRYISKSKTNSTFQRRICWLDSTSDNYQPIFVAEYLGKFKGHIPHGNSSSNMNDYIRTSSEVSDIIARLVPFVPSKNIYDEFAKNSDDLKMIPRNLKQLHNKKYYLKKKNSESSQSGKLYNNNYSD